MDTTTTQRNSTHSPHAIGIGLMVASVLTFTASTLFARQLSITGTSPWAILAVRGMIGLIFTAIVLGSRGNFHPQRVFTRIPLIARGLLGAFGLGAFYLGVAHIGAGMATLLTNTYVLFAIPISAIALKEKPSIQQIAWILIAFIAIGALVLARDETQFTASISNHLLVLAGAFMASATVVIIRYLHGTESTATIYSAQCIYSLLLAAPIVVLTTQIPTDATTWTLLFASGLLASIGQLTMTEGYKYLPVAAGGAAQLTMPALTAIGAWALFDERMTIFQIAASAVILVACGLATHSDSVDRIFQMIRISPRGR